MPVAPIPVPDHSLLAEFGGADDYRDCFAREVEGEVSLPEFIERFYCSWAFRPERVLLGLIGKGASSEDARLLARGEIDEFAAWKVVSRSDIPQGLVAEHGERTASRKPGVAAEGADVQSTPARAPAGPEGRGDRAPDGVRRSEILLRDFRGATASWLAVEPLPSDATHPSSGSEATGRTRLLFGSWVGVPDRPLVKALMPFHRFYSRVLLST